MEIILVNETTTLLPSKRESVRKYLFGDLKPLKDAEKIVKHETVLIEGVKWVSQFDETIFGEQACFCKENLIRVV